MQKSGTTVNFIETKNFNLKGYTLIEGFPGLGLAGTIGAKYLVDKLKFEQIGYVDSNKLLPIIRIQTGLPMHPIRIYASKKNKLAIILAEQIIQRELTTEIAKELVEWIKKKGIKRVISTSGIRTPDSTKVYAFASDEASKKLIKKNNIKTVESGITSGVTAMIMLYLKDNKIEAFCLLGNTKLSADYGAAAELVKTISKIANLKVDAKPLMKEAKMVQDVLLKHLKTVDQKVQTKTSELPMYT